MLGKWMNQSSSSKDQAQDNAKEKNTLIYFKNNFPTDLKLVCHQNITSYSLNFK